MVWFNIFMAVDFKGFLQTPCSASCLCTVGFFMVNVSWSSDFFTTDNA